MDIVVIIAYLAGMIAVGWWGKRRAKTQTDFLVAGRRLGPMMYAGTMAAVVLGGASTIGGVGLGYQYGISGMWLVVAIGSGVLALSLLFAPRILARSSPRLPSPGTTSSTGSAASAPRTTSTTRCGATGCT